MCIGNRCFVVDNSCGEARIFFVFMFTLNIIINLAICYVQVLFHPKNLRMFVLLLYHSLVWVSKWKKKTKICCVYFSHFFFMKKTFYHPQIAFKLMKNSFFVQQIKPTVALISLNLWRMKQGFSCSCWVGFFNVLVFHQILSVFFIRLLSLAFFWCVAVIFTVVVACTDRKSNKKKGGMGSNGLRLWNRLFCSVAFQFYLLRTCSWQTNVIKLIVEVHGETKITTTATASLQPVHTI